MPNWLLISISLSIAEDSRMPKSVTAVMAAHISTLIDSVQAVASRSKPRLMGEGMRVIVWGCCHASWKSMHMSSGAGIHKGQSLWLVITLTLCISAISWKYVGTGRKVIPFIHSEEPNAINTGRNYEQGPRLVLYRKQEEKKIPHCDPVREQHSFWLLISLSAFSLRFLAFTGLNETWLIFLECLLT